MKGNKEQIGLAGEYAVASELCRRGYYAQLTLGNHKKTDILVEDADKVFRVSVKSKTGNQWPKVGGIWQKYDLLVFVDFKGKELGEKPDFFVLNVKSWKIVANKIIESKTDGAFLDSENTVSWEPWKSHPKGWKGCAISRKQVEEYQEKWPTPKKP